ncbi:MAG: amidohydrolase family protein [Gammaproteobacteria bacterium]|nr:amidohydrolase family protein [Gammaproteobacteria bacterium]
MKLSNILVVTLLGCWPAFVGADVLFRDVKVVTSGPADGQVVDVLVRDDEIVELGEALNAPAGTATIAAAGKVLTAGFFNAFTHLGLTEVGAVADTSDYTSENSRITASLRISDAINPSSVLLPHNRMLGITHALVQPDSEVGLFAGSAALIQLTETDTVNVSSAAMVVKLGSQGKDIAGGSRAAAMALLREAFEDARDYRANKDSYNRGNRRDYQLSRHDLEALIPVIEKRIPLLVHVDRAADIERIIDFAAINNLRLIIAGAEEGWRVADSLAKNKVPVIIDPIMNLPASYDTLGARLDNARLLDEAGVTLLFTGMAWHNTHNAYLVRQSAGNAVANGLSHQAAIKALTSNPAKVFNLQGGGEVRKGAKAHLVLWSGDPLEPATIVEKVLINGVDQPLVSRATRLRDRYFLRLQSAE